MWVDDLRLVADSVGCLGNAPAYPPMRELDFFDYLWMSTLKFRECLNGFRVI